MERCAAFAYALSTRILSDAGMISRIDDAVRTDIQHSVLCWLATVDEHGTPNVSPKEIFTTRGDTMIVIANIASPQSAHNIQRQPKVCISFVDVFRQRGFKINGSAQVIDYRNDAFRALAHDLAEMAGPKFPFKSIIAVEIDRISRIWAPSYKLHPERDEHDLMRSAYATYGVQPV